MMNVKSKQTLLIKRASILFHVPNKYFTNTRSITCKINATDLDATAILLEPTRVLVGDVIPELLKSPVELQRLCKVPEL